MWLLKNISLTFLSACIALFFMACENDMKQVEALTKKTAVMPTESSTNLNVIFSDSGFMEYRLKAEQMDHYVLGVKEAYSEFTKGVHIESYDKNNKVKSTLKSDYAIRYDKGLPMENKDKFEILDSKGAKLNTEKHIWVKIMEAKYKIEIVNENGEKLNTEHIFLIEIDDIPKIISDTYVEIRTKKEIIKGTGMVANEDFSEWEIQNVSGTIPIDEKEFKKD